MELQFQGSLDLTSVLGEYFIHTLLDRAYKSVIAVVKNNSSKTNLTKITFENNLLFELAKTVRWAQEVNLQEFNYKQAISKIYVELDLYFSLKRKYKSDYEIEKYKFSDLVNSYTENLVIFGHPGAGKTTSLKHLCYSLLFEEKSKYEKYQTPLFIKLRDFNNNLSYINEEYNLCVIKHIYNVLGIHIDYVPGLLKDQERTMIIKAVAAALEELEILLILDGFDELTSYRQKEIITSELRELFLLLEKSRVILTSRHGEFNAQIENSLIFEVCSLSIEQVNEFVSKRFNDEKREEIFLEQLHKSTYYDAALRPLILAYLTLIFDRYGRIHDKPKEIYKRILRLLSEEWNVQNSVNRQSKYYDFDSDRKVEFLSSLAYNLTVKYNTSTFSKTILTNIYQQICSDFGLPPSDVEVVCQEIENHNGLLIETREDIFEFSHKSIQEYLTADYFMRQPVLNDYYFCYKIPNEMAISVALSTSPSKYLFQMITNWTKDYIEARSFYKAFCARILIEKPDFNDCFELVYSFLYMYKVVKGVTDKNTKESFYSHMYHTDDDIGDLVGDIENIFNTKVFQNAFKNNIHYEIVDSVNKYESKKQDSKEVLFLNLKRTSRKKFNGFSKCLFMNSTMYRNLMNE